MRKTIKKFFVIFFILGAFLCSFWSLYSFYFESSKSVLFEDDIKKETSDPDYWPISGWRTSTLESQGMSRQKLNEMEDYIDDQNLRYYIDSLLIIRNGYLVYESYPSSYYDKNSQHHIYSCTKVFTSALIGVAVEESYITGIDDYVLDYFSNKTFDNMDSRKQEITIRHLLTMTSGLEWTDQVNYYEMEGYSDWVQYILDRPMQHQPGMVWNYNTGCSHLLSAILEDVTPNGSHAYANTHLFNPLNITNYTWVKDPQGIPIGGTLLYLTPRDMAKFGFLYLMNGNWNGTQLIPSNWIIESVTPFMDVEFDQGHGSGYGYQWWIYRWANAYTARGSYEQYIVVIPDFDLIVVSTGNTNFQFIRLLVDYILSSVGFYPLNPVLVISLVVGLSALSAFLGFIYYRMRKKRNLRKIREKYFNDIKKEEF